MGKVMLNNVAYGGALSVIETTEENYLANKEAYDASGDFISITDADSLNAEGVDYDNSESGLESDNVQDAIDEVNENLTKLNDFSNEVIVGTFDGKSVYRKIVYYNGACGNGEWTCIDSSLTTSSIDKLLSMSGNFYDNTDLIFRMLPYADASGVRIRVAITGYGLHIVNNIGYTISKPSITLLYTKA